jgi:hypothetical protein
MKKQRFFLLKFPLGPCNLFAVGSNTQEPACAGEPWGG